MTREELIAKAKRKHLIDQAKAKFARSQELPTQTTTVQEQHPDISWQDRVVAKNFAQDQGKQVEFLQSKYPNLEFDVSENNQIRAKSPESREWNVLDPDTGFFSSDFVSDVGDVGYDLYSAGSEGLATAAGALFGGGATAGVGTIPGAMAAGGAMTGANEAARQKLGQYLGIPQEVSGEDVAVSAGVGAVAPMLFGAGKAKGAIGAGLDATGRGLKKINPGFWLGEKISGVPRDVLRKFYDPKVDDAVEGLNKTGVDKYTGDTFDKIMKYFKTQRDEAGENLVNEIDAIGRPVNMKPAKASYGNRKLDILKKESPTNADQAVFDNLTKAQDKYMGLANTSGDLIPDRLSANRAWEIQKDLALDAKYGTDMKHHDYAVKGAARDSYDKVNKALSRASDGATQRAKERFKNTIDFENYIVPKIKGKTTADSVDKTYKKLANLDRTSNKIFKENLMKLSKNAPGGADEVLENPSVWQKIINKIKPGKEEVIAKGDEAVNEIMERANVLNVHKHLGRDPENNFFAAMKSGNKVPLSLGLGAIGGYGLSQNGPTGNNVADYGLGFALGGAGGQLLGSRNAMKFYIRAARNAANTPGAILPKNQGLLRGVKTGGAIEAYLDSELEGQD